MTRSERPLGVNRAIARAARKAKEFTGSDQPINWDAVRAQAEAILNAERPMICPCCSFWWDQAEAEKAMVASPEVTRAWLRDTLALPVNEVGDDLGQRARKMIELEDLD